MNILRISSLRQSTDKKEQWWVHSYPVCAFRLSLVLVIFDGWLVSYHGQANNITCHLVDEYIKLAQPRVVWLVNVSTVSCFNGMLFCWSRHGFFAVGLYGWQVAGLVVWLIWSHVTFQFSFQSIITTYHFNWHISAFKPRFHTRTLVDRLHANMMAHVRQDLQTKVTDAFVHLNTRAPIARKETVGKKHFSFDEILLWKLYLTL